MISIRTRRTISSQDFQDRSKFTALIQQGLRARYGCGSRTEFNLRSGVVRTMARHGLASSKVPEQCVMSDILTSEVKTSDVNRAFNIPSYVPGWMNRYWQRLAHYIG